MKKKLSEFLSDLRITLKKKEMLVLPGHLAFFFVLSIVPIVTILFTVATSFNLSLSFITDFIEEMFSEDVMDLIMPILKNNGLTFANVIFLIVCFVLASNGFDSIIIASNSVFNIDNSFFLKRKVKAVILTIIMVTLFTFILVVPLFGSSILKLFEFGGLEKNLLRGFNVLYSVLNVPLSIFIVFFFIKLVYTLAPDEDIPSRYVNKGAIFTTIGWMLITGIYSYYIKNIAHFSKFYGGLANIVVLMLWFYFMAYVFVIGLAFNYRNVEEKIEETNTLKLDEKKNKVKLSKEHKKYKN